MSKGRFHSKVGSSIRPFYEAELRALRESAKEFGAAHPQIAARLNLDDGGPEDPHVDRLIESAAFLAARVQRRLDDDFPRFTNGLLGMVYPQLTRPVPSLSIAQLTVNLAAQPLSGVHRVARGANLLFPSANGVQCRFRTVYDVDLVPVELVSASLVPIERAPRAFIQPDAAAVVLLKFAAGPEVDLKCLENAKLRLFIDQPADAYDLHELLLNRAIGVLGRATAMDTAPAYPTIALGTESLTSVGFEPSETLLDDTERHLDGFRLLLEYCCYPEKFLFLDLGGLAPILEPGSHGFEIGIPVRAPLRQERIAELARAVSAKTFKLGCTPIVNLFTHQAEPIRATGHEQEHTVVPNLRRRAAYEVYKLLDVTRVRRVGGQTQSRPVPELFHFDAGADTDAQDIAWTANRSLPDDLETEPTSIALTFLQRKKPDADKEDVFSIRTLCSNANLAASLPFGEDLVDLELEDKGVIDRVRCLRKPSPTLRRHLATAAGWDLISHLSINHLSIVAGGESTLQGILSLYNLREAGEVQRQISAIASLRTRPLVRAMGDQRYRSFVRGVGVDMTLDESGFAGANPYLFSTVLYRFLCGFCALNTFVELSVALTGREGIFATWRPAWGTAIVV